MRDLTLVLSLAKAGSTAGAADALHITQSAVSRALRQAENRLGISLFQRSARGVSPTEAGLRLVAGAGALLTQLSVLEHRVAAPTALPTRLRLVCECYTAYRWLPSALQELRGMLPDITLQLCVEHTERPMAALMKGQIDIALLTTSSLPNTARVRAELAQQPLFADEVVFVLSASHPLARNKSLTREQLRASPLITSSNTPAAESSWFLSRAFPRQKPKLSFVRFPLTEAILDAARAGMGIAVMSEWMASGYLEGGGLVLKRLATGPLRRPWRMAYRTEATGAAERLKAALISCAPRPAKA